MTQKFVRYSPDVEHTEPDFERTLAQVLDDMKQHMRGSLKTEGIGLVVRNAHAKGYGLARGEVEILSGMPNEYAQGIYARPGRHEVPAPLETLVGFGGGQSFIDANPLAISTRLSWARRSILRREAHTQIKPRRPYGFRDYQSEQGRGRSVRGNLGPAHES